jgi:hypothetical protein
VVLVVAITSRCLGTLLSRNRSIDRTCGKAVRFHTVRDQVRNRLILPASHVMQGLTYVCIDRVLDHVCTYVCIFVLYVIVL